MPRIQDLTFDFDRRRAEIMDQLWRDLKTAFTKLERLEQLQGLLNEETASVAREAPQPTNGTKPSRKRPKLLAAPLRDKQTSDYPRIRAEAKRYIAAHPGARVDAITEHLIELGVVSRALHYPTNCVTRALRQDPELRVEHTGPSRRDPFSWYLKSQSKTKSAKAAKAAAGLEPTIGNLRRFIIETFTRADAEESMSPRTIKTLALQAGFPERHGKNERERLSNIVARTLRRLTATHQLDRKETGGDVFYSLNRPKITVTKAEN